MDILGRILVWILSIQVKCEDVLEPIPPFSPDEQDCPQPQDPWLQQIHIPWNIPFRAYLTIPKEVVLTKSNIPNAGLGILAQTFIPKYTWLAEYEGEVLTQQEQMTEYSFQVPRNEEIQFFIDAHNVLTSNWARWINCARNDYEENVEWYYCAGRVYYLSIKDIFPGQELLMYYGHDFAESMNITYRLEDDYVPSYD